MSDFLETIGDGSQWERFYEYCEAGEHATKQELSELRQFIDCGSFLTWDTHFRQGKPFPYAERTVLNKKGTDKKRVVYMFPGEAGIVLKYLSFRLHEYDGVFADNLFSFRMNRGVKRAVSDLLSVPGLSDKYVYKLDIHDYFNSVDVERIIPLIERAIGADQPGLCAFLKDFLRNPYVIDAGHVIEDRKGIMAGNSLSSFLANLYLADMDRDFADRGIIYARYSDDIIVMADTEEEIGRYQDEILTRLSERGMTVNPKKVFYARPGEPWDFLGITYHAGKVDVARASVEKMKGKIRRKARALYRWKVKKGASDEQTIRAYIRHFNRKFYANPNKSELTWCRWFFPVINTDESLKELDAYLIENIRFLVTGRHTKANYRLRYETIKSYGFRSLVHEYYAIANETAL
ncbi:MAG: hypothetical protein J6S79_03840 [Lachnospiraceae bacterium]|nr:hypothetical protein [Lachnospiraceae bacterium]